MAYNDLSVSIFSQLGANAIIARHPISIASNGVKQKFDQKLAVNIIY